MVLPPVAYNNPANPINLVKTYRLVSSPRGTARQTGAFPTQVYANPGPNLTLGDKIVRAFRLAEDSRQTVDRPHSSKSREKLVRRSPDKSRHHKALISNVLQRPFDTLPVQFYVSLTNGLAIACGDRCQQVRLADHIMFGNKDENTDNTDCDATNRCRLCAEHRKLRCHTAHVRGQLQRDGGRYRFDANASHKPSRFNPKREEEQHNGDQYR